MDTGDRMRTNIRYTQPKKTATQKTVLLNELNEAETEVKSTQNGVLSKRNAKTPRTAGAAKTSGARIMSLRRRWEEGSQNTVS